ncbi:MAG: bifunctional phosphopantothenoylcysteine decarboxylase/phosphopantothenate--cysteine ligase CoaBC [Alphaproteobacteria bacterium]|nr:bifunctional phosphopantothenoylcysteine decarboxylase/phosphopantothenate--cysteine ligase CoaBC [Alphaproteobacteria bacterium]
MAEQQKRILLIIGGGIAAYKTPELVRGLRSSGFAVRPLLTAAAEQFVSPLSLASVAGDKVYQNLFDLNDEAEMGHIQLSRQADMIVVAPASADLLGKMAQGLANDLASATLLASNKPILVAPAMNVQMWHHPATVRNMAQLAQDGVHIMGPETGDMACGEYGLGRMSEPADIIAAIINLQNLEQTLQGKKILITAGPTHEPLDPVRYIANRSSGKQGYALAHAIAARGGDVHLISGPTNLTTTDLLANNVDIVQIETAQQMWDAVQAKLAETDLFDVAICTAAVADWRAQTIAPHKIKSEIKKGKKAAPTLELTANPDILAGLAAHKKRPSLLIGFAAETETITAHATDKRQRKQCDWMIANDVGDKSGARGGVIGGVMGSDMNCVQLISAAGCEQWQTMSKAEVASNLADKIAEKITLNLADEIGGAL